MKAESNFRQAFERLRTGSPKVLPLGTPVSQNNVAREAGCKDPSALRKRRFPELVAEIQAYVAVHEDVRPPSERQRLLKQRQKSRDAAQTIVALKAQRDLAASLLVEANARIGILTRRVRDLEARVDELQPRAGVAPLAPTSPKASPRAMDMP